MTTHMQANFIFKNRKTWTIKTQYVASFIGFLSYFQRLSSGWETAEKHWFGFHFEYVQWSVCQFHIYILCQGCLSFNFGWIDRKMTIFLFFTFSKFLKRKEGNHLLPFKRNSAILWDFGTCQVWVHESPGETVQNRTEKCFNDLNYTVSCQTLYNYWLILR